VFLVRYELNSYIVFRRNRVFKGLTVAYDEYAMKKSSVFEWHRRFKGEKMCKMTQEVGGQKRIGQMQM
jgi:hypothetical protein